MTEAELERLAMLAEEAGEIVQAVTKIIRHGYESYHPNDSFETTNRRELRREVIDLYAVFHLMLRAGDLRNFTHSELEDTITDKLTYTHHQDLGVDQ